MADIDLGSGSPDETLTIRVDQDRTGGARPDEWSITTSQEISFGRASEIVLGDNPYLHRSVGRFTNVAGIGWQLQNDGSRIVLDIRDGSDRTTSIAPGKAATLDPTGGSVSFEAGSEHFVLSFRFGNTGEVAAEEEFEVVTPALSRRQLRVLLALCEPRLRKPDSERIMVPSVSQVASRLALSLPQVNDCVSALTDHHRSLGPATDTLGADTNQPLEALVRWAVASNTVTIRQLESLNSPVTQLGRRP